MSVAEAGGGEPLRIDERHVGDVTILQLAGRLVLADGEGPLRGRVSDLVRQGRPRLLLDLAGLTRIDSAGMGMLAATFVTVDRAGGSLKLLRPSERVRQLLKMTKLESMLEVFASEDEALRSFR
jgi:anti-sigma B factor antagonist